MQITRGELVFDVRDDGPRGGDPVLLLHGFPQTATSWGPLAARLHAAGYRTLAPDQRGYSPGARPSDVRAYALPELVADAAAVIDALAADGPGRAHVVGHDWGAAVAWALAARHPERVASLTALATPPPQALVRGFRRPRQALASWYIAAIMVPGLFERVHAWRPALTARLLERSGQTPDRVARDVAPLADRATLTAMLNWYRAMPHAGRGPQPLVTRPVLYVWGSGDTALLRAAAEDAPRWVRGSFAYVELPGATHWFPEQNVDQLAPLLLTHLLEHPLQDPGSAR